MHSAETRCQEVTGLSDDWLPLRHAYSFEGGTTYETRSFNVEFSVCGWLCGNESQVKLHFSYRLLVDFDSILRLSKCVNSVGC
jgi:hypothetical protein